MASIHHVGDLADWRLCLGCGACAFVCPDNRIELVERRNEGIRPRVRAGDCGSCQLCLQVCPGYEVDHGALNRQPGLIRELIPQFGPVLELWEGHAADPEIRFRGSSGGVITALSLYCLEQKGMHGVLHIGQSQDDPLRNETYLSRSREELLSRAGSRYAPASACDRLDLIERAPGPCVFVGQPSEVTALRKVQALRPGIDRNLGLALSFFCAGSPSRLGTEELLRSRGIEPAVVGELRYRGNGWPGMFSVTLRGESSPTMQMTYAESWGFVQAFRAFSTHLCPDGTGEDADISCGDPWYRPVQPGEPGSSLVAVRTERGRLLLRAAREAGYLHLDPAEPWKLQKAQANLVSKRGAIGGRIATLRGLGLPAPRLRGFSLFENWRRLTWGEKLRSTLGTLRRVVTRGYYRRQRPGGDGAQSTELPRPTAAGRPDRRGSGHQE